MLEYIIPILGPLPPEWEQKWKSLPSFHDVTNETINQPPPHPKRPISLVPFIRLLRSPSDQEHIPTPQPLDSEDAAQLEILLTACLKYRPAERICARQITELDWLKKALEDGPGEEKPLQIDDI